MSDYTGIAGLDKPIVIVSIAKKIINFAQRNLGKKVGNGQCSELANYALKKAGAKTAKDLNKTVTLKTNYKWGKKILLPKVKVGDILQFSKFSYTIKTNTTTTTKEGRKTTIAPSSSEEKETRPHHTAIVAENGGKGVLRIYEQNVAPPGQTKVLKKVQLNKIYVKAQKIESETKDNGLLFRKTIKSKSVSTITVSGKIWAYRALPK